MSEPHGNPSDLHSHASGNHVAGPPEPKTPMWLPALGAALFLTAGLFFSLMPSSQEEAAPADTEPSAAPAADAGTPTRR